MIAVKNTEYKVYCFVAIANAFIFISYDRIKHLNFPEPPSEQTRMAVWIKLSVLAGKFESGRKFNLQIA